MNMVEKTDSKIPGDLPVTPGVYLMKNERNHIIYVGKAKNINKRVSSYFRSHDTLTPKTRAMMSKVCKVDFITTLTEKDALLLESSLIKKHRPRYNIVLRDDKQYVLFKINKSHSYPSLELTRKASKDNSIYFGPFTSSNAARSTLKIINKIFLLRKCGHKKFKNRVRPCLQYYIQRCMAPCCLQVSQEKYARQVKKVELFLSGKSSALIQKLRQDMLKASDEMLYEEAAQIRDQIKAVEQTIKSQSVVIPGGHDMDIFNIIQHDGGLCIGIIFVRQGKVLDSMNFFRPGLVVSDEQEREEALVSILSQFYNQDKYVPERIILPEKIYDPSISDILSEYRGKKVIIRKARGDALKSLLQMALQNSLNHASSVIRSSTADLTRIFGSQHEILRVECIDVSHQSGEKTRVGAVIMEQNAFVKKDYRIFNLGHIISGDDYLALREFIMRRVKSSLPWPDLLLIDGGLGQLNVVSKALQENNIEPDFKVAAISKGPTRGQGQLYDQIFVPGRKNPINIKPGSPEMLLLQKIRDEAHRFVIQSMRKSRGKIQGYSQIEKIKGIGPKKAKIIWDHFQSLEKIRKVKQEELETLPGFGPQSAKLTAKAIKQWNTQNSS
ncbi:excinuclease ABC subunit UvrC [Desulfonatronovibrio magnus]|uniref:excinuclease ABC subunit UvrC n=1 Tax=Desulfonatronovibrio magnus TaxID=698827 RepID=UPI000696F706|nr:excinuclease ABC subunit UvrC [Desulfonatronovibrio magnus]